MQNSQKVGIIRRVVFFTLLARHELCEGLAIYKTVKMSVVDFQVTVEYLYLSTQQTRYEINPSANKYLNRCL